MYYRGTAAGKCREFVAGVENTVEARLSEPLPLWVTCLPIGYSDPPSTLVLRSLLGNSSPLNFDARQ